jgi:hypothetical protein
MLPHINIAYGSTRKSHRSMIRNSVILIVYYYLYSVIMFEDFTHDRDFELQFKHEDISMTIYILVVKENNIIFVFPEQERCIV